MAERPELPSRNLAAVEQSKARAEAELFSQLTGYLDRDFRFEILRSDLGVGAVFPFFAAYAQTVLDAYGREWLEARSHQLKEYLDQLKAEIPGIIDGVLPFPLGTHPTPEHRADLTPRGLWENCHLICWNASTKAAGGTTSPFWRALRNRLVSEKFAGQLKAVLISRLVHWKSKFLKRISTESAETPDFTSSATPKPLEENTTAAKIRRRRPGPAANMDDHRRTKAIVDRYGPDWKVSDESLQQIAGELDEVEIPSPPAWKNRNPAAHSWTRGLSEYKTDFIKAIRYRLEMTTRTQELSR